jgi:hypothetical protein
MAKDEGRGPAAHSTVWGIGFTALNAPDSGTP